MKKMNIAIVSMIVMLTTISILSCNAEEKELKWGNWGKKDSPLFDSETMEEIIEMQSSVELSPEHETVMREGMKIEAITKSGKITIEAGAGTLRHYTWDGDTRSVALWPRDERWYGSYGLYFPGPGDHWESHNGITRGVLEEGQQHFGTVDEALEWINSRWTTRWTKKPVYNNKGLFVEFWQSDNTINVYVWQILINGKIPEQLPGAQDDKIIIVRDESKPTGEIESIIKEEPKTTYQPEKSHPIITHGKGFLKIRVGDSKKKLIELLGKPSEETKRTGYYYGESIKFSRLGIECFLKDDKVKTIFLFFRAPNYSSFDGVTDKGIGFNSTISDVLREYGEPTRRGESTISEFGPNPGAQEVTLEYEVPGITFTFWDGELADIRITAK